MTAVERREIDVIVAKESARLYRSWKDLYEFCEAVERMHVDVATLNTGDIDLTTVDGRIAARLVGVVNAGESERIGERQRNKMARNARLGMPHGGVRAYGYQHVRDEGGKLSVELVPHEAPVIRECVDALLSGASVRSLVLRLHKRGIRTSSRDGGTAWHETTLKRMLAAPRLAGLREHEVGKDANGKPILELYEAIWPAIVTEDEHHELVSLLTKPRTTRSGGKHLLSGLLHCGRCGQRMVFRPSTRGLKNTAYTCPAKPRGCNGVGISVNGVEPYVVSCVDFWRTRVTDSTSVAPSDAIAKLTAEIDVLNERIERLQASCEAGMLDVEDMAPITRRLRASIATLRTEVDAKASEAVTTARRASLASQWATLDDDGRREALRAFIQRIDVQSATGGSRQGRRFAPARVVITLHEGLSEIPETFADALSGNVVDKDGRMHLVAADERVVDDVIATFDARVDEAVRRASRGNPAKPRRS
jgi:site-specific DNA recombinase